MATRANIKASISIDKNYISPFLARTTLVNVHNTDPSVGNKVILRRGLWRIQLRAEFGWKTFKVTSEWILRPIFFSEWNDRVEKKHFNEKKSFLASEKKWRRLTFAKVIKCCRLRQVWNFWASFGLKRGTEEQRQELERLQKRRQWSRRRRKTDDVETTKPKIDGGKKRAIFFSPSFLLRQVGRGRRKRASTSSTSAALPPRPFLPSVATLPRI